MMDKEEFADLVEENEVSMYRLALSIVRNQADAEDAAGAAVVKAWEHLSSLKDAAKFKPWMMQIVANEAKKIYGQRKRTRYMHEADERRLTAQAGSGGEGIYAGEQYHGELWDMVMELEEIYRQVIVLFYYEEMSIKEIGRILRISEGAVKSRLFRAKGQLRERL